MLHPQTNLKHEKKRYVYDVIKKEKRKTKNGDKISLERRIRAHIPLPSITKRISSSSWICSSKNVFSLAS
jgi:hypothetical protein